MHKTKGQKREEANERREVYRGLSKDKNLKRARSRRGVVGSTGRNMPRKATPTKTRPSVIRSGLCIAGHYCIMKHISG